MHDKCAQEDRLGGFEAVVLDTYSSVQGSVANGVLPGSIKTMELEEAGCILWKTQNLFCDPACLGEETCDFDGTCIPVPVDQNLGTVTVDGLNESISMEPREPGNNYFAADVTHPIFDLNNREVQLTTTAGYLNEITLHGAGSNAIEPGADEWIIIPGEDLVVDWDAPPADARTAVVLTLAIDQHGSSPSSLECEFKDTGEGLVPATVVDALIGAGVSGFPSGSLTRGTVDSVQVEQGCIDFSVVSHRPVEVSVSGYIPCSDAEPCPEGMTCNPETFLCE